MFINVDQALAPTCSGEEHYERKWLEDAKANGASEFSVTQARERMREDKNALLADQLTWLEEAGFEDIDCWYKRFRFVVYGASKRIESGSRGFFSPSPHTTRHAGPHRAVQRDYRAVAG
jgi:hypothetical protein